MYKFSLWISIREKLPIVPQDNHACATELGQEWMWRWCDSLLTWALKEERPEKAGMEGHARLASHGWRYDQRRLTRMDMHAWHPMGGGATREHCLGDYGWSAPWEHEGEHLEAGPDWILRICHLWQWLHEWKENQRWGLEENADIIYPDTKPG